MATLGAFFIFAVSAGHIRISERTPAVDLLEAIADKQVNGQLLTTLDGHILHANRAARFMLGRNELGDLNQLEQAFAGTQNGAEVLFRLIRANQQQRNHVEVLPAFAQDRDADNLWLRASVMPFGHVDLPEFVGKAALWTIEDISLQRNADDEQQRLLATELSQFSNLPVGVLNLDPGGQITFANTAIVQSLGYTDAAEVIGSNLKELVSRRIRILSAAG